MFVMKYSQEHLTVWKKLWSHANWFKFWIERYSKPDSFSVDRPVMIWIRGTLMFKANFEYGLFTYGDKLNKHQTNELMKIQKSRSASCLPLYSIPRVRALTFYLEGHQNYQNSKLRIPKKSAFIQWSGKSKSPSCGSFDAPWDNTSYSSTSFESSHT